MKTLKQLVDCANRELFMRRRMYPTWIRNGSLDEGKSEHELECMARIQGVLETLDSAKDHTDVSKVVELLRQYGKDQMELL